MPANPSAAREIFLAATEIPVEERPAFLNQACGTDVDLRQRVDALLQAHDDQSPSTGDFALPSPASMTDGGTTGERMGPYKLLQKLGEGGMGTVWLAEQSEPVRRMVALKVIKAGMDSAHVIARFEAERQALAVMDHPNIAKILDAGATAAGRPYFVMELVKGIPITKFCDQEHLTPTERLELFIPACQAVQHAHQKGIIHRDLKPSNIMVGLYDGRPVPKIIDFGVAKATGQQLTDRSLFTEVGNIIGTLEYMAPEQAELNNLDIDTRADIYSLGVILYELLAGSPPFSSHQLRSAAYTEMLRVIREVEPPRPSTKLSSSKDLPSIAANRKLEPKRLAKIVHGDLDWIVMKCLEKERGRRYETANALALELQRFMAHEVVLAGPPSATYRLRKFVTRNRGAVIAAGILLASLVFGIAGTAWQAHHAELAREVAVAQTKIADAATVEADAKRIAAEEATQRAEANFRLALDAFNDMVYGIQFKLADRPDTQDVRKELLDKAQVGLQKLLQEAEQAGTGHHTLNWAHFRMGDVYVILGEVDKALQEYRIGFERANAQAAGEPSNAEAQRDLNVAINRLGDVTLKMGNANGALEYYRRSLENRERLAKADPENTQAQRDLSLCFEKLGNVTRDMGDFTSALKYYRQHHAACESIASAKPTSSRAQRELSISFNKLGDLASQMNDAPAALDYFKKSLAIRERLVKTDLQSVQAQRDVAISYYQLGNVTFEMGDAPGALDYYHRGLAFTERLAQADPKNIQVQRDLSVALNRLGDITRKEGNAQAALKYYRQGLEIRERLASIDANNAQAQRDLSFSLNNLGDLTQQMGNASAALDYHLQGLEVRERISRSDPANTKSQRDISVALNKIGDLTRQLGNTAKAIDYYRRSLEIREQLAHSDPKNAAAQRDLAVTCNKLGDATLQMGNAPQALAYYLRGLEVSQRLSHARPNDVAAQRDLAFSFDKMGDATRQMGDVVAAREYYRQGLEVSERLLQADPKNIGIQRDLAFSFHNLGNVTLQLGDTSGALDYHRRGLEIRDRLVQADAKNIADNMDLFLSQYNVGLDLLASSQFDEAKNWFEKANTSLLRFQKEGWIKKQEQIIGAWSFRKWTDETQARLLLCAKADQAIADLDFALEQPAKEIAGLLEARLRVLAMRNDLPGCVATAEAMEKRATRSAGTLFLKARMWSQCSGVAKARGADAAALTDEYGGKAIAWLKQAVVAGIKDPVELKLHKDLESLRDRDDFKAIIKDLESKTAEKKPAPEKQP
jgi:eukaryotic-like serine/threonine-protein kinase